MNIWRFQQLKNEKYLCDAQYESEVVRCSNKMHWREGKRTSNLNVQMPAEPRSNFCYSYFSDFLVSRKLGEKLLESGLTGFELVPLAEQRGGDADFVEMKILWRGEFVANTDHVLIKAFCAECGLIEFSLLGDPPWDKSDIISPSDLFMCAPFFSVFCSDRARDVFSEYGGVEAKLVPAHAPLKTFIGTRSITWPPEDPYLEGQDFMALLQKIRSVDVNQILPTNMEVGSCAS